GLRIEDTWQGSLALRASGSHDVVLEGVRVPGSHALPPRGGGPEGSAWFWTAVAATYLGAGQAALDALVSYARARVPTALGEPISTLPAVQGVCGQIRLELLAAGSLLHAVTAEWETGARGELLPRLAGVKVLCTNAAVRATDLALRVAGGAALTSALPLERLFRDVRAGLTHPPADELAYGLLGRQLLEESGS
ncbi:MAG: acyl-CoA dehydrogenase family protein, partial [Deinococcus sp.]